MLGQGDRLSIAMSRTHPTTVLASSKRVLSTSIHQYRPLTGVRVVSLVSLAPLLGNGLVTFHAKPLLASLLRTVLISYKHVHSSVKHMTIKGNDLVVNSHSY